MRKRLFICVILLSVLLGVLTSLIRAEETVSQSYLVIEFVLKPDKIAEFEEGWKEAIAECRKQDYYLPIYTFFMDDFKVWAFYPMQLYSGLEAYFKATAEFVTDMDPEKLQRIHDKEYGALEFYKIYLVRFREDLSLRPDSAKYAFDQDRFVHLGLCYLKPGKEREFEASWKAIHDFYSKKGLQDIQFGWDMFEGDIGTEMPFYFFWEDGNDKGHFWAEAEKRHDAVGQELYDLFFQAMDSCRKFKMYGGWFRSDLSYIPGKKRP
jgi:hypothetical protein